MSNNERLAEIFREQNKQNFILEMVINDCQNLMILEKQYLVPVIECYEEFMIKEINKLFEPCNSFDEIAVIHQINFREFLRMLMRMCGAIDKGCDLLTSPEHVKLTEDLYVIYITLQEWQILGPKGYYFYSMLNINAFNFSDQPPITKSTFQTVFCQSVDRYSCVEYNIHSYVSYSIHRTFIKMVRRKRTNWMQRIKLLI